MQYWTVLAMRHLVDTNPESYSTDSSPITTYLGSERLANVDAKPWIWFSSRILIRTSFHRIRQTQDSTKVTESNIQLPYDYQRFSIHNVNFQKLDVQGSEAQLPPVVPKPSQGQRNIRMKAKVTSIYELDPTISGTSAFFGFQMFKEPYLNDHTTWWMIAGDEEHPIPNEWIANRNARRVNPLPEYLEVLYESMEHNLDAFRLNCIKQFVNAGKR